MSLTPSLPLHPTDIGLILSYHCQSACAHCMFNCAPSWSGWMSQQAVEAAVDIIHTSDPHVQLHVTGGEPFLNFPLLLHSVETAARLGVSCYVETNAGWCIHEDQVIERFSTLHAAGLEAILISCSPFHAEKVSPKQTLLAIAVALEIFGPRGVIVYLAEWLEPLHRFSYEKPVPLARYIQAYGQEPAGVMFWQGYALISGGRCGYRLGHLIERHKPSAFKQQNCRAEIVQADHSHFDLYGNLITANCGGLTIGQWKNLAALRVDFMEDRFSPLIRILVESGPFGLYEWACREYHYRPLKSGYAGKCHLCVDIRRHLVRSGSFEELGPLQFYTELERTLMERSPGDG